MTCSPAVGAAEGTPEGGFDGKSEGISDVMVGRADIDGEEMEGPFDGA